MANRVPYKKFTLFSRSSILLISLQSPMLSVFSSLNYFFSDFNYYFGLLSEERLGGSIFRMFLIFFKCLDFLFFWLSRASISDLLAPSQSPNS